jgi:hypothetical protein
VVEHLPRGLVAALNSLHAEALRDPRLRRDGVELARAASDHSSAAPRYIDMYPVGLAVLGCPMAPVHGQIPPQ